MTTPNEKRRMMLALGSLSQSTRGMENIRAAQEQPGYEVPTNEELDRNLGGLSAMAGFSASTLLTEIEELEATQNGLLAALSILTAHVIAMAQYIKYEQVDGVPELFNEEAGHGLEEAIRVANSATTLLNNIMEESNA